MQIVHGWRDLPADVRGASVALGNFDGVHRGHQRVIAAAARGAQTHKTPLGVISFEPHPRRYFQPNAAPFRLMTQAQLARVLEDLGVEGGDHRANNDLVANLHRPAKTHGLRQIDRAIAGKLGADGGRDVAGR